jgi:hypothetical protein
MGVLAGLLLLVACSSTTFVYNRLDFLLPWYVNNYANLNSQQKTYFEEILAPFLEWHRHQELPSYVEIIVGIEKSLDHPQTPETVAAVFAQMEAAWFRLEAKGLDKLLDLGAQLSDEQVAGMMDALWKEQKKFEEKYLKRSDEEFYEHSYNNLVGNAQQYLGTLTDEQRALLRVSSRRLLRSDAAWLHERAAWYTELGELVKRQPGWQQKIKDVLAQREQHPSPEYEKVYENNMGVMYDLVAQLLNGRNERQDKHLRARLQDMRNDLETLIAQGNESAPAPANKSGGFTDPEEMINNSELKK